MIIFLKSLNWSFFVFIWFIIIWSFVIIAFNLLFIKIYFLRLILLYYFILMLLICLTKNLLALRFTSILVAAILLDFFDYLWRFYVIFVTLLRGLFSAFFFFFHNNFFAWRFSTRREDEFGHIQFWNSIWSSVWSYYHNMARSKSCLKDFFVLKHQRIYLVRSEFIFIFQISKNVIFSESPRVKLVFAFHERIIILSCSRYLRHFFLKILFFLTFSKLQFPQITYKLRSGKISNIFLFVIMCFFALYFMCFFDGFLGFLFFNFIFSILSINILINLISNFWINNLLLFNFFINFLLLLYRFLFSQKISKQISLSNLSFVVSSPAINSPF